MTAVLSVAPPPAKWCTAGPAFAGPLIDGLVGAVVSDHSTRTRQFWFISSRQPPAPSSHATPAVHAVVPVALLVHAKNRAV